MSRLMIGDLARRTGTKVNTIRFYEDIGLMPRAARTESGRRTYEEGEVRRLAFIRHGRELGFSIDELRSLISLSDQPDRDCAEAEEIARRHLAEVEARISRLTSLRDELQQIATTCSGGRMADCRVIEAITDAGA
ncbi:MerR family transcriptional regulator [Sphingomonas parva]|uniref:MerR family transcriptional regulator n=1 Tax=Sphingomonas parva TaxID=2555898 RepID=A0A4Y8ZVD5_9SPHN|nr:helix-turn-helix domain-containing protein [Sphingomonas parva]TFI59874.1 MerR family transcriptional regulator [Sphingomonas parva]